MLRKWNFIGKCFLKREISEEEARELFPDIDSIYTISCKHGRIIMYGYQGFIVLYKNIGACPVAVKRMLQCSFAGRSIA